MAITSVTRSTRAIERPTNPPIIHHDLGDADIVAPETDASVQSRLQSDTVSKEKVIAQPIPFKGDKPALLERVVGSAKRKLKRALRSRDAKEIQVS